MAIAIVIILLVIGSLLFHFFSPWYFTPIASNWGTIDTTVDITFWVTGIVFVAVNLFMAWAVIRYRHRKGRVSRADYEPENKKLEGWLTAVTAVGVAAMLAPGLLVWADFVTVPDEAMVVESIGQQWHWTHRFPGDDGILGDVDASRISPENPFGIDPDDPNGRDDILINDPEVHLPINQPVKIMLRSKDVLHDFAVPEFRVKMDLVPGMVSYMWFEPTRTGTYEILCEEYCGIAHYAMRGSVVVDTASDFRAWLDRQPTFAELSSVPAGDAGAGRALYQACAACHGQQGEGNQSLNAPKLSGQEGWYLARQLNNYRNGYRGFREDDALGQQMRSMAATLVNDAAVRNVVAYIATLQDRPAEATIVGDIDAGQQLYETCSSCHGRSGQGIWSQNAPRQAGMSDWYLAAQLRKFRDGLRGTHRRDVYGGQMVLLAKMLGDDQSIDDLVAYINTLPAGTRLSGKAPEQDTSKL